MIYSDRREILINLRWRYPEEFRSAIGEIAAIRVRKQIQIRLDQW